MRHTTASIAAGIHPKIVQERLGHTSIKMTLDVYSHVGKTLQDSAAGELHRWMKPTVRAKPIDPPLGYSLEESPEALRDAARPMPRVVNRRRRVTASDRAFVEAINGH